MGSLTDPAQQDGPGAVVPARRDVLSETFDAVLFDNDSTLIDSRVAVERSWAAWARHYKVSPDLLTGTHGVPGRQTISRIAPELPLEEATAVFDRIELEHLDEIDALPGAREALERVGERAAIVTSAGRTLLARRLEAAGLRPPAIVVTADDVDEGKPSPVPYLEGARRLNVDPRKCLVVEDSVPGIRSARAAGAATLAVLTTATAKELAEADLVVADLSVMRFAVEDGRVHASIMER